MENPEQRDAISRLADELNGTIRALDVLDHQIQFVMREAEEYTEGEQRKRLDEKTEPIARCLRETALPSLLSELQEELYRISREGLQKASADSSTDFQDTQPFHGAQYPGNYADAQGKSGDRTSGDIWKKDRPDAYSAHMAAVYAPPDFFMKNRHISEDAEGEEEKGFLKGALRKIQAFFRKKKSGT